MSGMMTVTEEIMVERENWKRFWNTDNHGPRLWSEAHDLGLPVWGDPSEVPNAIVFKQIRYLKEEKVRTDWIKTNEKLEKKSLSGELISYATWYFGPARSYPRKQTQEQPLQADNIVFQYVMTVEKCDCKRDRKYEELALIDTNNQGAVITKKSEKQIRNYKEDVTGFRFPKRFLAKINRILYKSYLHNLWLDEKKPMAWYRTGDEVPFYFGTIGRTACFDYLDSLLPLLRSPAGDATAVLLSYVCFAVLRPLFPGYRTLNKSTPYLTVRRFMPARIAMNIWSDQADTAERMADLFCGYFRSNTWGKPATDGIVLLPTKKRVNLGVNEYEKEVLQSGCVLWVNRRPASELTQNNAVFDVPVRGFHVDIPRNKEFSVELVTHLTTSVHDATLLSLEAAWKDTWRSASIVIYKTLLQVNKTAERNGFYFAKLIGTKNLPITSEIQRLKAAKDEPHFENEQGLLEMVQGYERALLADIENVLENGRVTERETEKYKGLSDRCRELFKGCRREIRKICKRSTKAHLSLEAPYQAEVKVLEKQVGKEKPIQKMSCLLVSAEFFFNNCMKGQVPEKEVLFAKQKIKDSILRLCTNVGKKISAKELIEQHVLALFKSGAYARIRGIGCAQAKVWYDHRNHTFYLPLATYIEDIGRTCGKEGRQIEKKLFETELAEEGLLLVPAKDRRSKQLNVDGKGKRSLLALRESGFSESFLKNIVVRNAMAKMCGDETPYRA